MTQKIENVIGTENRSRAGVGGGWMTRKGGGTGLSRTGLCGSGGSWKWRRAPAVCGAAAGPVSDAAAAPAVAGAGLPVAQLVIWRRRAALSDVERCVQKAIRASIGIGLYSAICSSSDA